MENAPEPHGHFFHTNQRSWYSKSSISKAGSNMSIFLFVNHKCIICFSFGIVIFEEIGKRVKGLGHLRWLLISMAFVNHILFEGLIVIPTAWCGFFLVLDGPELFDSEILVVPSGVNHFWHQQWVIILIPCYNVAIWIRITSQRNWHPIRNRTYFSRLWKLNEALSPWQALQDCQKISLKSIFELSQVHISQSRSSVLKALLSITAYYEQKSEPLPYANLINKKNKTEDE